MSNIAILYCKKIKDQSCIACAKCYKGMAKKNGEFEQHDEIELVAMTDCGDCPGLTVPRVGLVKKTCESMDRPLEVVHFGSCMKGAMESGGCPIKFDQLKAKLEDKFGVKVILGTHNY